MPAKRTPTALLSFALIFILISLACNFPRPGAQSEPPGRQAQTTPTPAVQDDPTNTPGSVPTPTSAPKPTQGTQPSDPPEPSPTAATLGLSRTHPLPKSELAQAPNIDVQVLEVKRGPAAWQNLQAASEYNQPAADGMEYLLVKVRVKSKYTDGDLHHVNWCDFEVTGDRAVRYTCDTSPYMMPAPELYIDFANGQEADGWIAYQVAQEEGDLILDEGLMADDEDERFIALEEGASLSVPPDFAPNPPNELGREPNAPAPFGETVITGDWEVTVLDVMRGEQVWQMVQAANEYNEPPAEGMEYLLAKIHLRYINPSEKVGMEDGSMFKSMNSAGETYARPIVIDPEPDLNVSLYPGGEGEGWVTLQAASGATGVALIYQPFLDFTERNIRYLALEP
jgi:hypothetical protein